MSEIVPENWPKDLPFDPTAHHLLTPPDPDQKAGTLQPNQTDADHLEYLEGQYPYGQDLGEAVIDEATAVVAKNVPPAPQS